MWRINFITPAVIAIISTIMWMFLIRSDSLYHLIDIE